MKKSRFAPEQILQALRQAEGGTVGGELCRKLGVTAATFYPWREGSVGSSHRDTFLSHHVSNLMSRRSLIRDYGSYRGEANTAGR